MLRFHRVIHIQKLDRFLYMRRLASAMRRRMNIHLSSATVAFFVLTTVTIESSTQSSLTGPRLKSRLKTSSTIPRLHLCMLVASRTVVIRLPSNAYENTRTPSANRNDVSRTCESRFELRRHIFYRSAHDGNFLPAHLHGEKAGAREC